MKELPLASDFEAEQGVLAGVLYDPANMHLVADKINADDFFSASHHHADIWRAMITLYAQDIAPDTVAVHTGLIHQGVTEIMGHKSIDYLSDLFQFALNTGVDIETAAASVRNVSLKRTLHRRIAQMAQILHTEADAEHALEQCESLLFAVSDGLDAKDLRPLADIMADFLRDLDRRHQEAGATLTGIATGFDDLDALLGGMQKKELLILGGRPGEGKTSLLLNFVYYLLSLKLRVAFFSLEMSELDLSRRLVSMDTQIDSQHLRTRQLSYEQWNRVTRSAEEALASRHIFIDDSGDQSVTSIRAKARRQKAKHGLDLIVLDYLQMVTDDMDEKGKSDRRVAVDRISAGLKRIAKELNVPVLALASLSRAVESRADKRPQLSDLRESGRIESDADVVMFIHRSRERQGYSLLNIEKHRNGPIGDVWLKFNASLTRFEPVDDTEGEVQ